MLNPCNFLALIIWVIKLAIPLPSMILCEKVMHKCFKFSSLAIYFPINSQPKLLTAFSITLI